MGNTEQRILYGQRLLKRDLIGHIIQYYWEKIGLSKKIFLFRPRIELRTCEFILQRAHYHFY